MLHFYCDTVIKLIVQLQKKQYQAQGRSMEIPRGFSGGGEKKSKNLKKKLEFPKCGGRGSAQKPSIRGKILIFLPHASFIRLKRASVKKLSKFNWIILMTQKWKLPSSSVIKVWSFFFCSSASFLSRRRLCYKKNNIFQPTILPF